MNNHEFVASELQQAGLKELPRNIAYGFAVFDEAGLFLTITPTLAKAIEVSKAYAESLEVQHVQE